MEGFLPPGFRFYPTDEELVVHYLCKKASYQSFSLPIIAEVDLYKFNPWELPEKAFFGEKEWYFFSQREKKYPNGSRPNRAAASGYWKATGTDKAITISNNGRVFPAKIGVKKSLVFYKGKAPNGVKTNWIMHEYRLANSRINKNQAPESSQLVDWVVCRIYKKKVREEVKRGEEKDEKMTGTTSSLLYGEPKDGIRGEDLEMACHGVGFGLEDCLSPLNPLLLPNFPQEIMGNW